MSAALFVEAVYVHVFVVVSYVPPCAWHILAELKRALPELAQPAALRAHEYALNLDRSATVRTLPGESKAA